MGKLANCGLSFGRALLLALLEDNGASVYPNANYCGENREHDFQEQPALVESK